MVLIQLFLVSWSNAAILRKIQLCQLQEFLAGLPGSGRRQLSFTF